MLVNKLLLQIDRDNEGTPINIEFIITELRSELAEDETMILVDKVMMFYPRTMSKEVAICKFKRIFNKEMNKSKKLLSSAIKNINKMQYLVTNHNTFEVYE